ncbi:MAG TPA: Plug domain-containing protein, partial [Xanthobacteraceae bacterium]|nr:Plug domain-containing protein [Xanthobacteraceae bacterium]
MQQAPANPVAGQTHLPQIVVNAPKKKPKPNPNPNPPQPIAPQIDATTAAQKVLDDAMTKMDQARDNNLLTKIGASSSTISRETIEKLPQADNAPIDKVILQLPGVSYDSAVANPSFHVRNEYANVQIRINGVVVPEGVSGLGPFLDTSFIGSMSLLTGALPAEYGLRTAGVLDIT